MSERRVVTRDVGELVAITTKNIGITLSNLSGLRATVQSYPSSVNTYMTQTQREYVTKVLDDAIAMCLSLLSEHKIETAGDDTDSGSRME